MLLKSCNRCGTLVNYGVAYCVTCKPIVDKLREEREQDSRRASHRRYNAKRDPKYSRFYNSKDWRLLSQRYTQDKGYKCERCGVIATDVHHIKPIQTNDGWDRRLDYYNLELLCKVCHNHRHNRFKRKTNSV